MKFDINFFDVYIELLKNILFKNRGSLKKFVRNCCPQVGGTMGLYTQLTGWSLITLLHLLILLLQSGLTCLAYTRYSSSSNSRRSRTKTAS